MSDTHHPQTHFILYCTRMQLLHLLLLTAVPGAGLVLMALLVEDAGGLRAAYCGAGVISLITIGWLIVVLALSQHTGFYACEVTHLDENVP